MDRSDLALLYDTLNPKSLQGSVSSRAKNPSWGNPMGAQLHRLCPQILLGQKIQEATAQHLEKKAEGLFRSSILRPKQYRCGEVRTAEMLSKRRIYTIISPGMKLHITAMVMSPK